jgi:hypothetical protein
MGEGDYMPSGGHSRSYDPKHAAKIKEGGKKAQKIREMGNEHQKKVDVPKAEEELLKDLENLNK